MAVGILDSAVFAADNNTNPLNPSSGTDRYYVLWYVQEGADWTASSTIAIATDGADVTMDLISTDISATMNMAMYGCKDAELGSKVLSTANGSITGTLPAGSTVITGAMCFDGVNQTTPFTNTDGDGYSLDSTDSTENCPFTLDEIVGGMGAAFASCSKVTGVTWGYAGSYTEEAAAPFSTGTNTQATIATKAISTESLNNTTTFTTSLTGDKTGTAAIMLLQASTDTTAPTLTLPTGAKTGDTTATGTITTDEENGTAYAIVSTSSTPPSVAQIQAGNDSTGSAAAWDGSQAISTTGIKTFLATGLTASTTYYFYFQHKDAASNDSTVSSSTSFTTDATPAITTEAIKNYSGTIQASQSGWIANVYNPTTGALVVRLTGQTTDASGVMVLSDALIVAATTYRVDLDNGSGLYGNKEYTAA